MTEQMQELGRRVEQLLVQPQLAAALRQATDRARRMLAADADSLGAAVPIPLETFGGRLPAELRSCRVSVMRGGAAYHVERHPGAEQYVYSLENEGTISVWDGNSWHTSELTSDADAPLPSRWHGVAADTWHQPVPGRRDWAVLAFHTVAAENLVDDFGFDGPPRTG